MVQPVPKLIIGTVPPRITHQMKLQAAMPLAFMLALLLLSSAQDGSAATVNLSNVLPRRDSSGAIMDMHDGNVHVGSDGTYYWYAAGYGERIHQSFRSAPLCSAACCLLPAADVRVA